jgi:tetratricopeptide (TPR) repeat protein
MMKHFLIFLIGAIIVAACESPSGKKTENKKQKDTSSVKPVSRPSVGSPTQAGAFEKPSDRDMQAAIAAYNQAINYFEEGDMQKAMEQFKVSLEVYPENSKTNHYIGRIYYDMGQKELAMAYYEDAVRFNIDDSISMLGIGQIYFDMGDYENAMKYYDMTIDISPDYGLAYYNRGTLLGMQNQYNPALEDLNRAIELDPENGNAYVNRGLAHYYLKDLQKACEDWQKAADMGMPKAQEAISIYCN